jgi:membrane-associated phospholipid phosphatase
MLKLLSQLAEIGFAGPLIILALATLSVRGHPRVAVHWGCGILLGLGAVVLSKWSMADDPVWHRFPSGHVALAVTFYGGLVLVLFRDEVPPTSRRPLIFLTVLAAIALAEGISRMVLTEHDWRDVVGGFLAALCGLAVTGNPWTWEPIGRRDRFWTAGTLLVALPIAWVIYPHINPLLRHIAGV